jgi:D-proline reductase (dithiol) PrdB
MAMSKRCIPYTPRSRELKQSVFALVTTTGVHLRTQEPYIEDDNTWRLIPGDVQAADLMMPIRTSTASSPSTACVNSRQKGLSAG